MKIWGFILIALVMVVFFWFDRNDRISTFNDAIDRGEYLRDELNKYFNLNKDYPNSLDELRLSNMPGKRWYGKTIILYKKEVQGYSLSFADQFTSWTATETDGFEARK